MRRRWVLLAVLSLAPASVDAAGTIRGTIWSSRAESRRATEARERTAQGPTSHPGRFDYLGTPSLYRPRSTPNVQSIPTVADSSPAPGVQRIVLTVTRIPPEAERRLAAASRSASAADSTTWCLSGAGCSPGVLAVVAGTTVRFENRDTLWHRVFGTARTDSIDIGGIGPGESRSRILSNPGSYAILCGLHSTELGFLVVTPNHAFAQPDSLGRFTLPALPPGRYELAMWDPEHGFRRIRIDLPRGRDLHYDLAF